MEWIEHDEVSAQALPEWARQQAQPLDGAPYRVRALPDGLVLERRKQVSALRWIDILVPIRVDQPRRLLIAAARRPPRPPWFEVRGPHVAAIERAIRLGLEALEQGNYRAARPQRQALRPDHVLTEVLERRPVPGAVEIPAARMGILGNTLIAAAAGAGTFGYLGLLAGPIGAGVGALIGGASAASAIGVYELSRRKRTGRVLVLTPDCFVAGFDGVNVRAAPWYQVGRFADGVDERGTPALEVFGHEHERLARIPARYFGEPLDIIVAVAEAYRRRTMGEIR